MVSITEARATQQRLSRQVIREDRLGTIRTLAGVDVAYDKGAARAFGAVAVLDARSLELVASATAARPVDFPYVPGLFSFREIPVLLEAMDRLPDRPDVILCDGHGIAHPRRCGLACHLGLEADLPTIGVAKTPFIGTHSEPARERGSWTPLCDGGETVGAVLRTRTGVRPVYVSIGHRVSLRTALHLVVEASPRTRLPETTRHAHRLAQKR